MAVVGQREADSGAVAVRVRGEGNKQKVMPVTEFVAQVVEGTQSRALVP